MQDAALERLEQFREKCHAEGFYAYGWENLARELDWYVQAKAGGSKKPFGNILAVKSVRQGSDALKGATADGFAAAVANDPEL